MGLNISGQPIPVPMGTYSTYKFLSSKEPSKNIISVTYTDTSAKGKSVYKKAVMGSIWGMASLCGGNILSCLAQLGAVKLFPKLENKFPSILVLGSVASFAGFVAGTGLTISNSIKMKQYSKTILFKDGVIEPNSGSALPTINKVG